jgi:multidrug resistance efflux pump
MKKWTGLLVLVVLLSGCASPASPEATLPPVEGNEEFVTAEGVVEPERWVALRAPGPTTIAGVPVQEGEVVSAGDLLVELDATDAELAVRQAEAQLAAARARLVQARESPRPEQIALLEAHLLAAGVLVTQTVAARDVYLSGETEADLATLQAERVAASVAHEQAVDAHQESMRCYDVTLPGGGVQEICPALGPYEEMARAQEEAAHAALQAAQAQLEAVEGRSAAQLDEAQAGVAAALARRDAVRAQLALARAGSSPETIAAAEAGVEQAEAALARARATRDEYDVRAPFDGVVVDLPGAAGQAVTAGQPVAILATLRELQVRATDLTELDVARVTVGQPATIRVDGAPDRLLQGRVVRVDPQGREHLGDVTFPVFIALDEPAPDWLRWGMTVEVALGEGAASALPPRNGETTTGEPVIAEAVIEPQRWGTLTFTVPGRVAEVRVAEGDRVAAGDVLAVLNDTQAAVGVQEAEAALRAAEAELALRRAQPRPEDVAAAEAELAAAGEELAQALALQRQLTSGGAAAEVETVRAQLAEREARRVQLAAEIEWVEGGGDAARAERLREEMAVLEQEIEALRARLAALPRSAAAELRVAQAGVAAAAARRDVARAQLALVEAGSETWEIALAEAAVEQAQAALAAAEAALERSTLRAPFDGTVTQVHVEPGDRVAPGQAVLVMGTLDRLQVKTMDLLELDVARVAEGQPVAVRVDALRSQSFAGRVVQVGLRGELYRGDVTYPVVIELEEGAAGLMWGMTAVVEIGSR